MTPELRGIPSAVRAWTSYAQVAAWSVLAIVASCSPAREERRAEARRRHVVLIVADTLRADHLSTYGYPAATAPHLDQRSQRGTRFEHAYTAAPWTLPALASLMTSTWPRDHGAGLHGEERNLLHQIPLPLSASSSATIAECLKSADYRSAAIVTNPFFGFGIERGFDQVDAAYGSDALEVVARGEAQLDAWGERGGFLYLHFMDAHDPLAPDAEDLRALVPDRPLPALPQSLLDITPRMHLESAREERAWVYDAAIRRIDRALERMLHFLESRGWLEDAIVIFTADHGEALWEHERIERWHYDRGTSAGMGHGQSLFQELMGVPLIVWARELQPGHVSAPVSIVDIAPSLLEWLDCPVPGHFKTRGHSLNAAQATSLPPRDLVLEGIGMGRPRVALVDGAGIKVIAGDGVLEPTLSYDDLRDPREVLPLANDARAQALAQRIQGPPALPQVGLGAPLTTPAVLESLRSLGYLSGAAIDLPQSAWTISDDVRELPAAALEELSAELAVSRAEARVRDASAPTGMDGDLHSLVGLPGGPHAANQAAFLTVRARARELLALPTTRRAILRLPPRGELRLALPADLSFELAAQIDGEELRLPLASPERRLPALFEAAEGSVPNALPPLDLAAGLHVFRDPHLGQWRLQWIPRPADADVSDRVTLRLESTRALCIERPIAVPAPHPSWSLLAATEQGWRAVGSIVDPPLEGEAAVLVEDRIWVAGAGEAGALWLYAFAWRSGQLLAQERLRLPFDSEHRVQQLTQRDGGLIIDLIGAERPRRLRWPLHAK